MNENSISNPEWTVKRYTKKNHWKTNSHEAEQIGKELRNQERQSLER